MVTKWSSSLKLIFNRKTNPPSGGQLLRTKGFFLGIQSRKNSNIFVPNGSWDFFRSNETAHALTGVH